MLRFELTFLATVLFALCFTVTIFEIDESSSCVVLLLGIEIDDEVTNFNLKM